MKEKKKKDEASQLVKAARKKTRQEFKAKAILARKKIEEEHK
jgi:hypothetical protein